MYNASRLIECFMIHALICTLTWLMVAPVIQSPSSAPAASQNPAPSDSLSELPVIRAGSRNVTVVDGDNRKENDWYVIPETNPDIYYVEIPRKRQKVTFQTDLDSISFDVEHGQHYDFIILLNDRERCHTRISAVHPPTYKIPTIKPNGSRVIPFTMRGNRIYFRGRINGSQELNIQFDLGAGASVLNYQSAGKIAMVFDKQGTLQNSHGRNVVRHSTKNTVEIGSWRWEGIDFYETRNMGSYEDAIVGNYLFLDHVYEIDYDKQQIVVHDELPAMEAGYNKLNMLLDNGVRPAIEAEFVFEGCRAKDWFLFDTGHDGIGIVGSGFSTGMDNHNRFTRLLSFGDSAIAFLPKLVINEREFTDGIVRLEQPGHGPSRYRFGGLLGNRVLKKFNAIVNNHQGEMYLKPNRFVSESLGPSQRFVVSVVILASLLGVAGIAYGIRRYRTRRRRDSLSEPVVIVGAGSKRPS